VSGDNVTNVLLLWISIVILGSNNFAQRMSQLGRYCSLIPGLGVKLSTIILAGPTVLSAVGRTLRMMA
jgi:hypothetical protein